MPQSIHTPTRALPDQPDLAQLKRQAKELHKAYTTGDADAMREVRAHLPDAEPETFKLTDAQLVLARAYGYGSWPKLRAYVNGVTIARLADAIAADDGQEVKQLLRQRPDLVHMDTAADNEHQAIHYAVLANKPKLVALLMRAGADARKGIYPHRDATTAWQLAHDRGLDEITAIIETEETARREAMNCPNVTVQPTQQKINQHLEAGEAAKAIGLLEADTSLIKTCDDTGATVLHVAAQHGQMEVARWLLDHRASLRKMDRHGSPPIDRPIRHVHWRKPQRVEPARQMVQLLRDRGSELTAPAAVVLGDTEALAGMIDRDPKLQARYNSPHGGCLLTWAVMFDQPDALRLMLERGFDPDARLQLEDLETPTFSWGHPLWLAAAWDKQDAARQLLAFGADASAAVYASGDPLSQAINAHHQQMKQLLIEHGAIQRIENIGLHGDVQAARQWFAGQIDAQPYNPTEDPIRAMLWAGACGGCEAIVQMCLDRLDWPNDDPRWRDILSQPLRMHRHGPHQVHPAHDRQMYARTLKLMLDHGADVNGVGRFGATLMHDIAAVGKCWDRQVMTEPERVAFAQIMLDAGARLDVRDELLQSTPLGWACRWGCVELVDLLLKHGAEPEDPDAPTWATPQAWAMKMGHEQITQRLAAR